LTFGQPTIALLKQTTKDVFPSLWVRWRLMHRPRSAEIELALLKNFVGREDVTIDVGANIGLYTRTLARLSSKVHAFEPSKAMADILRRTTTHNVIVHEMALSDGDGVAELRIPRSGAYLIYSLASIELDAVEGQNTISMKVPRARLDAVVHDNVSFVKIDVEGHELNVLRGSLGLIERCRPAFLVEAEERHHSGATASLFEFFNVRNYDGFFLRGHHVYGVGTFDVRLDQDYTALHSNGGRRSGGRYINNFFFFPSERNGRDILSRALISSRETFLGNLRRRVDH
jgi:FkbM family methyltransferase